MSDGRAIGVFDSGLGGLTVVRELLRLMPAEKITYLGDTARCPYGSRSDEVIKNFGKQDTDFLISQDIKMVIVACNTVSSVALEAVKETITDIPVIGVVHPGARAAVLRTAEKKIGVIGTRATVHTESYPKAIHSLDPSIKVIQKACPLFVPLVEEGMQDSDIARTMAQRYLYRMVDIGVDCIILGCTHYPLLLETIQGTVGNRIECIDSALWAAKEAQDILAAVDAVSPESSGGFEKSIFYVTDMAPRFERSVTDFLGQTPTRVEQIHLDSFQQEPQ